MCYTTGLPWIAKQALARYEVEYSPFPFMALLTPFFVHTHTHKQRNYYKPFTHSGKLSTKEFSADTCICKIRVGR